MKTLIVVPARYASKRFPGKPLAKIGEVSMLRRTCRVAQEASSVIEACDYVVATDDERIQAHCCEYEIPCVLTDPRLKSGSDRALSACTVMEMPHQSKIYTHIINLQGDAPFTPAKHVVKIHAALLRGLEVATPYIQMTWCELDVLRKQKKITPFSGTTLIKDKNNNAVWFSKEIIPALRKEKTLRESSELSPVCRHIGLYGYKRSILEFFIKTPESRYEELEGLEQLRLLENGVTIKCVKVQPEKLAMSGIDTAEDLRRAEKLIAELGDPFK